MGIQINGNTDTISAIDGSLNLTGAELPSVTNLNATGIVTASSFRGALAGNVTGNVIGNLTGNINSTGVSTFSGGVVVAAGSTSAPSISPTGDSNTGIFFPSPDTIAFVEGGVESARIDSSGRFGIGTQSPLNVFHTKITTDRNLIFNTSLGGDARITALNDAGSANVNFVLQGDNVILQTGGGAARVDGSGRLLVGTSVARSNFFNSSSYTPTFQLEATTATTATASIVSSEAGTDGGRFILAHQRSGGVGGNTVLNNGDEIGRFAFQGSDGAELVSAAQISAEVDGTPGANDMPGRIILATTADAASSPTERLRIDSSGRILVNSASSSGVDKMHIQLADNNGLDGVKISGNTFNTSASGTYALRIGQNIDNNGSNSAALRIDHTNPFGGTGGALIQAFGNLGAAAQRIWQVNGNGAQTINRPDADGTLVAFEQAQVAEGSISVSGTTVSYNGAHLSRWSQIPDIDPHDKTGRPEILRGTVMSNLDEMCEWMNPESGEMQDNEQLNKTKISDVEGDKNVSGVFQSWDDDDDTWVNDYYLAMTGDFIIRIAEGVTVERGDLLMSAGDGTAKPQDDDLVRSCTIAKVTSITVSCTHPDGSYCVPCVLMAC